MLDVGINVLPPSEQPAQQQARQQDQSAAQQQPRNHHHAAQLSSHAQRHQHGQQAQRLYGSSGGGSKGGGGRLVGDVAFREVAEVASALTPVPGGIGPMTIAALVHNVILAARYSAGLPWAAISRPSGGEAKAVARAAL